MKVAHAYKTFEDKINYLADYSKQYTIMTLHEIFRILGHSSNYAVILFLITPFLQPIPLAGLSTACGILIFFCSLLTIFKKPLFLPRFARDRPMKTTTIRKICNKMLRFFAKTKRLVHARGKFMNCHIVMSTINGLLMCLLSLLLALPLPLPFTNTIPSVSIALLSIGSIKEDGIIVIMGWLMSCITFIYFYSIIIIPMQVLRTV